MALLSISTKVEYGLRALFHLAQRYGAEQVTSAEIAERQRIPEAYLNHLLLTLRNAGLVRSVRGPKGGHTLARAPASILLAEAIVALDGELCSAGDPATSILSDMLLEDRILHEVWGQAEGAMRQVLEATTLDDLCQRKLGWQRQAMFYI